MWPQKTAKWDWMYCGSIYQKVMIKSIYHTFTKNVETMPSSTYLHWCVALILWCWERQKFSGK